MIPETRYLTVKGMEWVLLRSPRVEDAREMIDFLKQTAGESDNLLRTPEEITLTVPEEEAFLRMLLADPRRFMLSAYDGKALIGNVSIFPIGVRQRVLHRCELGIAVKRGYWGQGIGRALMEAAILEAKALRFEQVELGVYADNERATRLYEKLGFEKTGVRKNACKMPDGSYRDELIMSLIIKEGMNDD